MLPPAWKEFLRLASVGLAPYTAQAVLRSASAEVIPQSGYLASLSYPARLTLELTDEEFHRVRHQAEELYRSYGQVYCPYFQDKVHFNTKGFRHLLFKTWNRSRDQHDQFMRLKHLHRAPEILRLNRTVQGIVTL